jgi:transposase-like protein
MNKQTCPLCSNRQLITYDWSESMGQHYRCIKCKGRFEIE